MLPPSVAPSAADASVPIQAAVPSVSTSVRLDWCSSLPQPVGPLQEEMFALLSQESPRPTAADRTSQKQRAACVHNRAQQSASTPSVQADFLNWLIACCDKGAHMCLDWAIQPTAPSLYTSPVDSVSRAMQRLLELSPLAPLSRAVYRRYIAWYADASPLNAYNMSLPDTPAEYQGLQVRVAVISAGVGRHKLNELMRTAIAGYIECLQGVDENKEGRRAALESRFGPQAPSPWEMRCFLDELVPFQHVLLPTEPLWAPAQFAVLEQAVLHDGPPAPPSAPPPPPDRVHRSRVRTL